MASVPFPLHSSDEKLVTVPTARAQENECQEVGCWVVSCRGYLPGELSEVMVC